MRRLRAPEATVRIDMRLSPEDRERLDQLAKALHVDTATAVVRMLVRTEHKRLKLPEPEIHGHSEQDAPNLEK